MATRLLSRYLVSKPPSSTRTLITSLLGRSSAADSLLRPLSSAVKLLPSSLPAPSSRTFSSVTSPSTLTDSQNWSNRPPKETILLDGCDFNHWLVVMEKPPEETTRDEIIDGYIKTLAKVVGSEDEARMKIYSVSTRCYFAFGALVSEELSYKLKELPGVRWVLPDSYLNVKEKDYGGEPFINGQAVPYDPKYHEEWERNNQRAMERNRRNDRPRNNDRSRNFSRPRGSPQGSYPENSRPRGGSPQGGYPGQPNQGGYPPNNMAQPSQGGYPPNSMAQPNQGGYPPNSMAQPNQGGYPPNNMAQPNQGGYPSGNMVPPNQGGYPQNNMIPPNQAGYTQNNAPQDGFNTGGMQQNMRPSAGPPPNYNRHPNNMGMPPGNMGHPPANPGYVPGNMQQQNFQNGPNPGMPDPGSQQNYQSGGFYPGRDGNTQGGPSTR